MMWEGTVRNLPKDHIYLLVQLRDAQDLILRVVQKMPHSPQMT